MTDSAFVARLGGIYEHSAWVAEEAESLFGASLSDSTERIAELMADCVDNASKSRRRALLDAHPDLAGKLQVQGELTASSTAEQASAGLDQCSEAEYAAFNRLNTAYREKFGFPFIMAVRGSTRAEILAEFERRLGNDPDEEFETAIAQVHRIARLRLSALDDDE